jgi:hypothetical protein
VNYSTIAVERGAQRKALLVDTNVQKARVQRRCVTEKKT